MAAPQTNTESQSMLVISARWWTLLFSVCVFTAGFWAIDHTPFASDYFEVDSIVAESENRTADRIEAVNVITAPVRMFMGFFGLAFLFMPISNKLNWGGIILVSVLSYGFYCGASALWSVNQTITMQKFLVLCFFGAAAYGTARFYSIRELAIIFVSVCVAYIGIGVLAELALGNFTPHKKEYRFVGTCHPNSLAVYGTFGCLITIAYFNINAKLNRWMVLLFAVGIVTLLLTKSRTTLAAFAFSAIATWFMTFRPNNRVLAVSVSLLLMVVAGLTLALSKSHIQASVAEKMAMGRTRDVSTLTGRLPLWELLVDSIQDKPYLGYGYLAYWDKQQIEVLTDRLQWEIPHGHNMYLDVLLDGGIIALLLYIAVFLSALLITGYRAVMFYDRDSILVFGFTVFAVVHGFAESLFKLPTFLLFMLLVLVLRIAFQPVEQEESPLLSNSAGLLSASESPA